MQISENEAVPESLIRDLLEIDKMAKEEPFVILDVVTHTTPDVGGCTITGYLAGQSFTVYGSSKRGRGDRPNSEIAERLAVARALQSLANRALRQANGLVVQADHVRDAHRPAVVADRRKQYANWMSRRAAKRKENQNRALDSRADALLGSLATLLSAKNATTISRRAYTRLGFTQDEMANVIEERFPDCLLTLYPNGPIVVQNQKEKF